MGLGGGKSAPAKITHTSQLGKEPKHPTIVETQEGDKDDKVDVSWNESEDDLLLDDSTEEQEAAGGKDTRNLWMAKCAHESIHPQKTADDRMEKLSNPPGVPKGISEAQLIKQTRE